MEDFKPERSAAGDPALDKLGTFGSGLVGTRPSGEQTAVPSILDTPLGKCRFRTLEHLLCFLEMSASARQSTCTVEPMKIRAGSLVVAVWCFCWLVAGCSKSETQFWIRNPATNALYGPYQLKQGELVSGAGMNMSALIIDFPSTKEVDAVDRLRKIMIEKTNFRKVPIEEAMALIRKKVPESEGIAISLDVQRYVMPSGCHPPVWVDRDSAHSVELRDLKPGDAAWFRNAETNIPPLDLEFFERISLYELVVSIADSCHLKVLVDGRTVKFIPQLRGPLSPDGNIPNTTPTNGARQR